MKAPSSRARGAVLACALFASACSDEALVRGLEEPIRVDGAQFREGDLPGLPGLTAEELNAGVKPRSPTVTSLDVTGLSIASRLAEKPFSGRATPDAAAVAVRFPRLGTGYWLIPTASADPLNQGELLWSLRASFGQTTSPGNEVLTFAAVDQDGIAGTQSSIPLCLEAEVPDNGNACDPRIDPPKLVVSLAWNAAVDLDLRVVAPNGKVVDSKHPNTLLPDEDNDIDPREEGAGIFSADSNARCSIDNRQRENLVFQDRPAPGTYLVYASLYDACGEASVAFDASLHASVLAAEGNFTVAETFHQAGSLQAIHANGGASLGLFVTQFVIQ
jgi:hypothetical protein